MIKKYHVYLSINKRVTMCMFNSFRPTMRLNHNSNADLWVGYGFFFWTFHSISCLAISGKKKKKKKIKSKGFAYKLLSLKIVSYI